MSAARILDAPTGQPLASLDSWRVVAQLGQGGMAEVYLATRPQESGDEIVVIKRLHSHLDEDPAVVAMFLDEARIALRLVHPNVVRTFELGLLQGRHALVMEYLEGQPVSRLLARATTRKRPLPCDAVVPIVAGALDGLHHAHEALSDDGRPLNLVHRDVSPHNLFLLSNGRVKVLDFGIAKTAFQENRTRTGLLKGKVSYMAPEQAWGRGIDRRADVWSMGVVLWEMLTGKRLFKAENEAASLHNTLNAEIPLVSRIRADVPADLERIVVRALQREPAERYPSAGVMALELRSWARQHTGTAQPNTAHQLFYELFSDDLADLRRRLEEILVPAENGPISGSVPLPRLHLPASVGPAPGTNLSTTVTLGESSRQNQVMPVLWSLLAVAGFAVGLFAYDVFTRPNAATPAASATVVPIAEPVPATAAAPAPKVEASTVLGTLAPPSVPGVAPGAAPPALATAAAPQRSRLRAPRNDAPSEPARPAPIAPSEPEPNPPAAEETAEFGYLTLDTSPWSSVSAAGVSLGQTPIVRAKLPVGTHTLVLANPDLNLKTRYQVRIEAGRTTVRRVGLE